MLYIKNHKCENKRMQTRINEKKGEIKTGTICLKL